MTRYSCCSSLSKSLPGRLALSVRASLSERLKSLRGEHPAPGHQSTWHHAVTDRVENLDWAEEIEGTSVSLSARPLLADVRNHIAGSGEVKSEPKCIPGNTPLFLAGERPPEARRTALGHAPLDRLSWPRGPHEIRLPRGGPRAKLLASRREQGVGA